MFEGDPRMTRFVLSFTPLLPIPVLWVLAVLALVVVALGFLTRRRGTTLRALAFALMVLAMADPSLVREDREGLKDVVAVVIDQSGSQTIGDRAAQDGAGQDRAHAGSRQARQCRAALHRQRPVGRRERRKRGSLRP